MPSTFTVKNTGNVNLEVEEKGEGGGGQARKAELTPGEERTYTVDKNSHVQIRAGDEPEAQPKR